MVSQVTAEQLERVDDPSGMLVLLKLEHAAMDTAYVVNDTRDWIINSLTYVGLPFRFKLPSALAGEVPRASIEIDNVNGVLSEQLDRVPPNGVVLATFILVSRARPTVPEFEFQAPMTGVSCTVTSVSASIGNDDAWRSPAVKLRFDPMNSPGLFAG